MPYDVYLKRNPTEENIGQNGQHLMRFSCNWSKFCVLYGNSARWYDAPWDPMYTPDGTETEIWDVKRCVHNNTGKQVAQNAFDALLLLAERDYKEESYQETTNNVWWYETRLTPLSEEPPKKPFVDVGIDIFAAILRQFLQQGLRHYNEIFVVD